MGQFTKQKPTEAGIRGVKTAPGLVRGATSSRPKRPETGISSGDTPPTDRWVWPRAGRAANWSGLARPLNSRRRERHSPPAFSGSPLPPTPAPVGGLTPRLPVWCSSGPGPANPASTLGPGLGPSPFPHFLDGSHHLLDVVLGPAAGLGPD